MNNQTDLQEGFFLEDWLVEPQLGRLTRDKKTVQLEPKIMQVLVYLAEHQGKVVKKQQFFKFVWADVNVTEHVLARAISELRRAFSDNPQNPLFIETIPKIGYRLIMPISYKNVGKTEKDAMNYGQAQAPLSPAIQISSTNMLFFLSGIAVFAIFLLVFILFVVRNHSLHSY